MIDQALDATQTLGKRKELQALQEASRIRQGALQEDPVLFPERLIQAEGGDGAGGGAGVRSTTQRTRSGSCSSAVGATRVAHPTVSQPGCAFAGTGGSSDAGTSLRLRTVTSVTMPS